MSSFDFDEPHWYPKPFKGEWGNEYEYLDRGMNMGIR